MEGFRGGGASSWDKESALVRNKARVAGVIAMAAAGMMVLGAPAFAATSHGQRDDVDINHNHVYNGINLLNENNIQIPIGICGNNVGILGAAIPVLSPQTTDNCASASIDQSSDE